nr:ATP-binding protein [uncultured Rhodopila sp.]
MVRRTITDDEIALIKAMVERGMKNRDIQFFFNRPNRAVNSGRITGIGDGTYSNSADIARASDDELEAFLESRTPSTDIPLVVTAAKFQASDPLSQHTLRGMFSKGPKGVWHLHAGETDQAECKLSFGLKHPAAWMRAVAAFANNRGGYVFFGVQDKNAAEPHRVVGLNNDDFANTDPAEIAKRLRSTFDPTPRFQTIVTLIGTAKIGVLYVEQHPSRPVIATKNEGSGGEIKEGDIFFRYPGQSARIKYADLRAMLDARDAQARADILPMMERVLALGPTRAMVADLEDGRLMDGKNVIELDEDIIKRLHLIKEGEFNERTGAPALRLIGDVKTAAPAAVPATVKKGLVTRADMQQDFLSGKLTAEPLDYVRCAIEVSGNDWLPIRYFACRAGLSNADLLAFIIDDGSAIPTQKELYRKRLASPDAACTKAKGPQADMLRRILAGEDIDPKDIAEARLASTAVQGVPRPLPIEPTRILALLRRCAALIATGSDKSAKSALRKAIARLDEVMPA